jgi:hypothetical protein
MLSAIVALNVMLRHTPSLKFPSKASQGDTGFLAQTQLIGGPYTGLFDLSDSRR